MIKNIPVLFTVLLSLYSNNLNPQTQNYEVAVDTVTVWVRVLDKDSNPVQGLQAKDFEIYEDEQQVPLSCFEEVGTTQLDPSISTANKSIFKKWLVIYLDLFSVSSAEFNDLRPAVNNFLNIVPRTHWEVMMAAFLPDGKLRILVERTNDFEEVRSVLERLPLESRRDLDLLKKNNEIQALLRNIDAIDRERVIRQACKTANIFANEERQISQHSLHAMETLMDVLSKEEPTEQKVITHFSAGFNSDPDSVYYKIIEEVLDVDLNELSVEIPECRKDLSFHPSKNVQKTLGGMNRSNVTLYSIHTRALYPGLAIPLQNSTVNISESSILSDYRFFQESMAEESGGKFFPNLRKFNQNINKVISDLEHQYILCYRQPKQKEKSAYRKIKVRCRNKGVEVRHRKGYVP